MYDLVNSVVQSECRQPVGMCVRSGYMTAWGLLFGCQINAQYIKLYEVQALWDIVLYMVHMKKTLLKPFMGSFFQIIPPYTWYTGQFSLFCLQSRTPNGRHSHYFSKPVTERKNLNPTVNKEHTCSNGLQAWISL